MKQYRNEESKHSRGYFYVDLFTLPIKSKYKINNMFLKFHLQKKKINILKGKKIFCSSYLNFPCTAEPYPPDIQFWRLELTHDFQKRIYRNSLKAKTIIQCTNHRGTYRNATSLSRFFYCKFCYIVLDKRIRVAAQSPPIGKFKVMTLLGKRSSTAGFEPRKTLFKSIFVASA